MEADISLNDLMGRIRGQPSLTTEQKARIAGIFARVVGSGRTTVSSIVSQARTRGTVETAEKSNRPRLNSEQDLMQLQRSLASHPKSTLAE
ncbi:uncharacterized protein PGTG_18774, partial [Puccinia graminis f. sp. tritici CRL 75-36-700-3]